MRFLPTASVLCLLLCAGAVLAADPNMRDDPLVTEGNINALAVAGASGSMAAATQDPGILGSLTGGSLPDLESPVWFLWEQDGDQVWAGHADRMDCSSRLDDDCVSHAVAVGISDDGRRMAVASRVDPSELGFSGTPPMPDSDPSQTLLILVTHSQGVVARGGLEHPVADLAVSADGSRVAVLTRAEASPTSTVANVTVYAWPSGSGGLGTPVFSRTLGGDAHSIRISPDGREVAVLGDRYWHFPAGTGVATTTSVDTHPASDAAVGPPGDYWTVVGYERGTITLYRTEPGLVREAKYSRQPTTADITSVAMSRNAPYYAAGDTDGRIHMFAIDGAQSVPGRFLGSFSTGSGAVRDLSFSHDGKYLALRAGSEVRFLHWDGAGMHVLWTHRHSSSPSALAMDGAGDVVAAAVGSNVRVYDALHALTGTPPSPTTVVPGGNGTVEIRYRNDGNRVADAQLTPRMPAGWNASLSSPGLHILPDGTEAVALSFTVPATHPPGTAQVTLEHQVASTTGETRFNVNVPLVRDLRLETDGPRSIGVDAGTTAVFHLKVGNRGNTPHATDILVHGAASGWTVTVEPARVEPAPGASAAVQVRVQVPAGLPDGSQGTFRVGLAEAPEQELELLATVGARFEAGLEAPGGINAVVGNETVIPLTLTNRGNAPDSLRLTLGNVPTGWVLAFPDGTRERVLGDLAPGTSVPVDAVLSVPSGAEPGGRFMIEVTVASLAEPASATTRTIVATLVAPDEDPGDQRSPGAGAVFLLGALALAVLAAVVAGLVAAARRTRPGA